MRIRNAATFALFSTLAAECGGAGGAGGPAPDGALAVRMPAMSTASFLRADTTSVSVDAGMMGTFDIDVHSSSTVDVAFSEGASGVDVTATYTELSGSMTNPMGAPMSVDESAVEGQLSFSVDARGRATVSESLTVQAEALQIVSPSGLAHELFPRLPDRAVTVGDTWTDTVTVEEDAEGMASETRAIVTYTVAGDTVVAGTTLLKLTTISDVEASVSGTQQGMAMTQNMSGTSSGWLLWDRAASLVHSSYGVSEMAGLMTIDAPGAPDMSLSVSSQSYNRRVGN